MIVYIDMDDVLCDYSTAFKKAISDTPSIGFPQSQYGFYQNLLPIKGAISAALWLLRSKTFNPYILTAPSIRNPMSYTEKRVWVEKHLGIEFVERLIISPNKSLLKGEILIDDRVEGNGQEGFEGKLIWFGSREFTDWECVIDYLRIHGHSNE